MAEKNVWIINQCLIGLLGSMSSSCFQEQLLQKDSRAFSLNANISHQMLLYK